jgi:alkyldihydroxyacetonephosphate synthase
LSGEAAAADLPSDLAELVSWDVAPVFGHDAWPLAVKRLIAGRPAAAPIGVARPRTTEEVARIVRWAAAEGLGLVPRGGGSSVTGAAIPADGALVLDLRRLDRILELDEVNGQVSAEAGVLGGQLEARLAESGWTTWFCPQSLHRSTVGGWVATGASGQFSSRFGSIEDIVAALTVVLADGRIVRLGAPPRGAVGPDLMRLIIGMEGTLAIVTEVTLRIQPLTPLVGTIAFTLPSLSDGLNLLRRTMQKGLRPALLRLYDEDEARHLAHVPPSAPVLLSAFTGVEDVADAEFRVFQRLADAAGAVEIGPAPVQAWLENRFDFSRIETLLASPGGFAETIEVSGGWREIEEVYRSMKEVLRPLADELLGHFSHTYTNGTSLYLILLGRAADDAAAVERLERIWDVAMESALATGAVISHHHGVGQARARFLARQPGTSLELLAALKRALDPAGLLHPGALGLRPSGDA